MKFERLIIFIFGAVAGLAVTLFLSPIKIDAPVYYCEQGNDDVVLCHKTFPNTVNNYFTVQRISP